MKCFKDHDCCLDDIFIKLFIYIERQRQTDTDTETDKQTDRQTDRHREVVQNQSSTLHGCHFFSFVVFALIFSLHFE